jgi:hypothetical protein
VEGGTSDALRFRCAVSIAQDAIFAGMAALGLSRTPPLRCGMRR